MDRGSTAMRQHLARIRSSDRARWWVSILLATLFAGLFVITLVYFFTQARKANVSIMYEHVNKIKGVLSQINNDCTIINVGLDKTYINFLNVKSFSGSEIGSLTLAHPENWKGPYLQDNFAVQGIGYYLLRGEKGYYIVPGDGIILNNGKVLGRDIIIGPKTDIPKLLLEEKELLYQGKPLIANISFKNLPSLSAQVEAEAYGAFLAE